MTEITTQQIKHRLHELKSEFASADLIRDIYGLDVDPASDLVAQLNAWASRHYEREAPVVEGDAVHRWRLETYLQRERRLSVRWAAARLGMTTPSFRELAERLVDEHLLDWSTTSQLIREDDVSDIHKNFEGLKWRTFGSVQSFCKMLHEKVEGEFGIIVEPLHCITSESNGEEPVLYAQGFDLLTDQPTSTRHEHWLRTGKPMHLRPDVCATLTLFHFKELLTPYLFEGEDMGQVERVSRIDGRV